MTDTSLTGHHLLVVGGSGTIGQAVVGEAVRRGAFVTATSRSGEPPANVGDEVRWRALDVTDADDVDTVVGSVADGVSDVVLVAAARPFDSLEDMPMDDLRALVDTKLWGAFHIGRAAARHLAPQSTLTFVSGMLAGYPDAAAPVAAVSAAVETLGRGLAVELAPRRVNVVSPAALGSRGRIGHEGTAADVADAILATIQNPWMSGAIIELHGAARP